MTSKLSDLFRAIGLTLTLAFVFSSAHAQSDPPGRVARLNYSNGNVTFSPAGTDEWTQAQPNRPLTTGDRLWADRGARSELYVGSTAMRLGSDTSLDFLTLNDTSVQLKLSQGALHVDVRTLTANQSFEIDTPNIAFVIQEPGEYRVNVAEDGSASTVTIYRGGAIVYGDDQRRTLQGKQQLVFSGQDISQVASSSYLRYDEFDQWVTDRNRGEEESTSVRYISREVPGYQQLDTYGTWQEYPDYGAVWIPRGTAAGWSPYSTGHWSWIAPWGWTWIDDAPWGFAPYHYGRWAHIHDRWCWVPGRMRGEVPVYAPALVAFVGSGHSGFNFGLSLTSRGVVSPGVAWFPLGPGEAYYPSYGSSAAYIRNVNRAYVHDSRVNKVTTQTVYVNQSVPHAVIAAPAANFVKGEGITPGAHWQESERFQRLSASTGAPAIAPVRQSVLGAARITAAPAVSRVQRPVIATTTPEVPAASRDVLARRYTEEQRGTIPGAGPALARPQNDARSMGYTQGAHTAAVITVPAAAPVLRQSTGPDNRREITGPASSHQELGNVQATQPPVREIGNMPGARAGRDVGAAEHRREEWNPAGTQNGMSARGVTPAAVPAIPARDNSEMELRRAYGAQGQTQGQGRQESARPVTNSQAAPAIATPVPQPMRREEAESQGRNFGGQQGRPNSGNERYVQPERSQPHPQPQPQPQSQPQILQPQMQQQQPQVQPQPQPHPQAEPPHIKKLTPEEERERAHGASGGR
jgi:hypothetical protein